jgi:hypothetical protein
LISSGSAILINNVFENFKVYPIEKRYGLSSFYTDSTTFSVVKEVHQAMRQLIYIKSLKLVTIGTGTSSYSYPAVFQSLDTLEFLNSLWGLGTGEEKGCRTRPPEPVFVNVYGDQESIPRNRFRQPM